MDNHETRTIVAGQAIGGIAPAGGQLAKRLRRLLHHASKHTAYFGAKLANVRIDSIRSEMAFSEMAPLSDLEDLEASRARSGDPFSGRRSADRAGQLLFQLENDGEYPLYVALDRREMHSYARALEHCWRLLGLSKGDRVAIFDFGSSPLSYLASGSFLPYLSKGAADGTGCIPVCNDGVSQMSQRAIEIARLVRPRVFFVRSDCVFPFAREAEKQGVSLKDYIGSVVVAEDESVPSTRSCRAWSDALGIPVYRLLRADAAMFLGVECPSCGVMHVPGDLYFAEVVAAGKVSRGAANGAGTLVITNLFARVTPSIRYRCPVHLCPAGPGCPVAPEDSRFRLL